MKKISWWRTTFGQEEVQRITESIAHEYISQGHVTAEFEKGIGRLLDIPYVVATTSGSTAILMSLVAAGVKPGDEVIIPNRTWIATAHAPLLLGAKVVLVDVEADRPVIDVTKIEERVTRRTKAIIPVHLNGRSVNINEINRIAAKHGLKVIEDAAQAFCSRNARGLLGCLSDMGCFSLSVAKIISTGQGGFVVTKNKHLYERLRMMRTHGVRDLINVSYTQFGFNFRFNDILASIGVAQLARINERISKVKRIYMKYREALSAMSFLKLIPVDIEKGEIPIYVEVLCPAKDKLVKFLAKNNIQTRPFYPDLHLAPYLRDRGSFPNSIKFGKCGLVLPCGPAQSPENIDRVISILKKYKAK